MNYWRLYLLIYPTAEMVHPSRTIGPIAMRKVSSKYKYYPLGDAIGLIEAYMTNHHIDVPYDLWSFEWIRGKHRP